MLDNIGGVYCEDCDIAELLTEDSSTQAKAKAHQSGVMAYSLDEANAKRLWKLTEEMTGVAFDIN